MRSIPLLAATSVILAAAWSCGGGGTGVNVPVANFTVGACTAGTACQFTNTSTPASGLTYSWDFGDQTPKVTDPSPAHTFTTAGTYTVALTVTDASSATNVKSTPVTVAAGTNQPPVASFALPTPCTAGTPCGFHSTSTDADGTITTSHWDFGDPTSATNTADTPDATHTYQAAGSYSVALQVTDNAGGTNTANQTLVVTPAASQSCTTTGTVVNCSLVVAQKSTVKITLVSHSCELSGNKLTVEAPFQQTAFFNICNQTDGSQYTVLDATGAPQVFQPGTPLTIRFTQGNGKPGDPAKGDPGIRIQGTWTLNVDDGGAAAAPGEPDFNDAVFLVQATAAP
jgi:PKD repeat protein